MARRRSTSFSAKHPSQIGKLACPSWGNSFRYRCLFLSIFCAILAFRGDFDLPSLYCESWVALFAFSSDPVLIDEPPLLIH